MFKKCPLCKVTKNLEEFRRSKNRADGRDAVCRKCKVEKETIYREKNREKIREAQRNHYNKNSELIKEKRKKYYDPVKSKARWLAKKIEAKQCIFCDKKGERHHKDYSKPLDIVFLCKSHHKQVHDETINV